MQYEFQSKQRSARIARIVYNLDRKAQALKSQCCHQGDLQRRLVGYRSLQGTIHHVAREASPRQVSKRHCQVHRADRRLRVRLYSHGFDEPGRPGLLHEQPLHKISERGRTLGPCQVNHEVPQGNPRPWLPSQ